jgi:hypothetical protein
MASGANNPVPLTDDQVAARTGLAAIAIRQARGEKVAQSAISQAIRAAAEADYDAQFTRTWKATS